MSTTGGTQSFAIPLHGEMYYQKNRPDLLWFYCRRAPAQRGQTVLADGREIASRLSDESKQLLRSKRLRYIRELAQEDWATSFKTSDPEELRQICRENDMSLELRPEGSVRIQFTCPAMQSAPDGQEVFINNSILLWEFERGVRSGGAARVFGTSVPEKLPLVVRFEDGSELPETLMTEVLTVAESLTVEVQWQNNDIVIVDNRWVLHGRKKTAGEDREILVRLGNIGQAAAA
jgi:alpha-ketoglutarate-dependent taurine dioxygenase